MWPFKKKEIIIDDDLDNFVSLAGKKVMFTPEERAIIEKARGTRTAVVGVSGLETILKKIIEKQLSYEKKLGI